MECILIDIVPRVIDWAKMNSHSVYPGARSCFSFVSMATAGRSPGLPSLRFGNIFVFFPRAFWTFGAEASWRWVVRCLCSDVGLCVFLFLLYCCCDSGTTGLMTLAVHDIDDSSMLLMSVLLLLVVFAEAVNSSVILLIAFGIAC